MTRAQRSLIDLGQNTIGSVSSRSTRSSLPRGSSSIRGQTARRGRIRPRARIHSVYTLHGRGLSDKKKESNHSACAARQCMRSEPLLLANITLLTRVRSGGLPLPNVWVVSDGLRVAVAATDVHRSWRQPFVFGQVAAAGGFQLGMLDLPSVCHRRSGHSS